MWENIYLTSHLQTTWVTFSRPSSIKHLELGSLEHFRSLYYSFALGDKQSVKKLMLLYGLMPVSVQNQNLSDVQFQETFTHLIYALYLAAKEVATFAVLG